MAAKEPDQSIIERYLIGKATSEEVREVEEWYRDMTGGELIAEIKETNEEETGAKILGQLRQKISAQNAGKNEARPARRIPLRRWIAAASIIVAVTALGWLFIAKRGNQDQLATTVSIAPSNDALPGSTRATLTLSDGKRIVLDSAKNGLLTEEAGTDIVNANGALTYAIDEGDDAIVFNTLSTQRGEQYPVTLSDGTKAWLNANSSIRFPVIFAGSDRKVQITGEVYFEVAKNKAKPFLVQAGAMTVKVLGTHFNMNTYSDEPEQRTTLIEGSVEVLLGANSATLILQPGQQAQVNNEGKIRLNKSVNIEQVMAWKNGVFRFDQTSLEAVMRQLSRWYDVDIVYEGKIPDKKFGGGISRRTNLSQVLKILEESQVKFRVEGKKLIVNANQ